MKEVSNKVLVGLLVVAIVVSLVGTLVSLDKLGKVSMPLQTITGAVTDTGTATITIAGVAAIKVVDNAIDFGSGYVNASCTAAFLSSDGETLDTTNCWLNSTGDVPAAVDDHHTVENNGTVPINISAALSDANASDFLCGTGGCPSTTTAQIEIKTEDGGSGDSGACDSGLVSTYTVLADDNSRTSVSLCDRLGQQDSADLLEVNMNLTIPHDVDYGAKTTTVTYTGEAVT